MPSDAARTQAIHDRRRELALSAAVGAMVYCGLQGLGLRCGLWLCHQTLRDGDGFLSLAVSEQHDGKYAIDKMYDAPLARATRAGL